MKTYDYQNAIDHLMYKNGKLIPLEVCCMGLAGEIGELFEQMQKHENCDYPSGGEDDVLEQIRLELGDVLWYTASIAKRFEIKLVTGHLPEPKNLIVASGKLIDALKKQLWHDKPAQIGFVVDSLFDILDSLQSIAYEWLDQGLGDIAQANVDKLKKRWPHGFGDKPSDPAEPDYKYVKSMIAWLGGEYEERTFPKRNATQCLVLFDKEYGCSYPSSSPALQAIARRTMLNAARKHVGAPYES